MTAPPGKRGGGLAAGPVDVGLQPLRCQCHQLRGR